MVEVLFTNSVILSLENPLASAAAINLSRRESAMEGTTRPVSVTYSPAFSFSPVLI